MTTRATAPTIDEKTVRERSREQDEPDWLSMRRLDAWRAFEAMAMPSPLEEEWRRTDVSALDLAAALQRPGVAKKPRRPRDLPGASGKALDDRLRRSQGHGDVMARQWFIPGGVMPLAGVMIDEDGEEEYFIPALGMFNEDQAAAAEGTSFPPWISPITHLLAR